jgi:hypothetical protein
METVSWYVVNISSNLKSSDNYFKKLLVFFSIQAVMNVMLYRCGTATGATGGYVVNT